MACLMNVHTRFALQKNTSWRKAVGNTLSADSYRNMNSDSLPMLEQSVKAVPVLTMSRWLTGAEDVRAPLIRDQW